MGEDSPTRTASFGILVKACLLHYLLTVGSRDFHVSLPHLVSQMSAEEQTLSQHITFFPFKVHIASSYPLKILTDLGLSHKANKKMFFSDFEFHHWWPSEGSRNKSPPTHPLVSTAHTTSHRQTVQETSVH